MGNWAYFSTGAEYKFAVGLQRVADILTFGGTDKGADEESGLYWHEWSADDMPYIRERLAEMRAQLTYTNPIDFAGYEESAEGTRKLWNDLLNTLPSIYGHRDPLVHSFILGCVIYHQMMYAPDLKVEYEG